MIFKKIEQVKKFKNPLIKAKIISSEGSVPRETGTFMLITKKFIFGSIGGGQLEFNVINRSKDFLKEKKIFNEEILNIPLGPSIGQCCGGYTQVRLTKHLNGIDSIKDENKDKNLDNLFIFGAGHIGKEIVLRSSDLDFNINLVDSRKSYLINRKKNIINNIYVKFPWMLIKNLPINSYFLILTHSHDFDFKIINELLKLNNFKYVGLIGSKTKKKRFENRLLKIGHNKSIINKIECPMGIDTINSKKPPQIAISIIARLLEFRNNLELMNSKNPNQKIKIHE